MGHLSHSTYISGQSGTVSLSTGSDRVFVGIVHYSESSDQNTSPTYGGNGATGEIGDAVTDNEVGMEMHYWLEADLPAAGNQTFDIGSTSLDTEGFGTVTLDGRNQGAPDDFVDVGVSPDITTSGDVVAASSNSDAVSAAMSRDGTIAGFASHGTDQVETYDAAESASAHLVTATYETGIPASTETQSHTLAESGPSFMKAAVWSPSTGGSTGGGGTGLPIGVATYHLNQMRK